MATQLPLKLARPAQRALAGAGITSLADFSGFSEQQIAQLHGIGKNALAAIKTALAENGLGFAQ
ncbi:hypothetical protein [Emticicia sp. 17c]|uniref:hypothetical protein n=1 Tax=Emticicia sp. 17c TaxID=3127704 RepID=UPI00301D0AD3